MEICVSGSVKMEIVNVHGSVIFVKNQTLFSEIGVRQILFSMIS